MLNRDILNRDICIILQREVLIVINFVSREMLQDSEPVPAVEMSPQRGIFILKVFIYIIVLFFMSNSFVFFIFNSTMSLTG